MKANSAFMFYTEQAVKLKQIANKQTMFLVHVLFYAEFDTETKQYIVDLSVARKKEILAKLDSKSTAGTNIANQYLAKISKAGIIKSMGDGRWLVNPEGFSGYKYIPKHLRHRNARIYETKVFAFDGVQVTETYTIDDEGIRHDLN